MNDTKSPYSYPDFELDGIYHVPVKTDGSVYLAPIRLSEIFAVVGKGTGDDGTRYHVISYGDNEYCVIARGDVGTQEGWKQLRNNINIPSKRQKLDLLTEYIQEQESAVDWRITDVAGWHDDAYILPNGEIVGNNCNLFFNAKIKPNKRRAYNASGTLEEWKQHIGRYAAGNSRFCLALGAAFAAPLLRWLNVDGGILHVYGQSSSGKTTAQRIALSVWGHGKLAGENWNSTALAVVNNAAARNDGLLALDEIGEDASGKSVDQSIYTLANGQGRAQGAKDGGNRAEIRFRTLVISSGETSLEGHMSKHGRNAMAGQLVRCPSIPHALEEHHDFPDFRVFTQHLTNASYQYYGTVGREFICRITDSINNVKENVRSRFEHHLSYLMQTYPLSDQSARSTQLFAAAICALELACKWDLTGFSAEEGIAQITRCFADWQKIQPNRISYEEAQIIRVATDFVQTSDLFFLNPDQPPSSISLPFPGYVRRAQFEDEDSEYFVFPKIFMEQVVKGFDEEKVKEVLYKAGWLQKGADNRWIVQLYGIQQPGQKRKRLGYFYLFRGIQPPGKEVT